MITVSETAKQRIKTLLVNRKKGVGIKVGVRTSGCSGMAYTLEYLDNDKFNPGEENIVFEDFVIRIAVEHTVYLKGLHIDYVKNGLNEGFEFQNPNEKDRCGCGESFRV